MTTNESLRNLPAVDEILQHDDLTQLVADFPRQQVVDWIRQAIQTCREKIVEGCELNADAARKLVIDETQQRAAFEDGRRSRGVVNATGILLHTNLGRAQLAAAAIERMQECAGAANVEMNLHTGSRNKRGECVAALLAQLTGAEDAVVVNNCAAATMLTLQTLAAGREVIVSRGQLVEIGGGYRLPEVFATSGAILKEVGTTNRTYRRDYEAAITENAGAIIRVHRSNFALHGFVTEPDISELVEIGRQYDIPVIDDLGSGCMESLSAFGLEEPTVPASIAAGADVALFSGDKLFGGPQAGLIVGRRKWTEALRSSPLMRALRVDKMTMAALEATTEIHLAGTAVHDLPLLKMLALSAEAVREHCEQISDMLSTEIRNCCVDIVPTVSQIGGGSVPGSELASFGLRIQCPDAVELARRLRSAKPGVVGRVQNDAVILDARTVPDSQTSALVVALNAALRATEEESETTQTDEI